MGPRLGEDHMVDLSVIGQISDTALTSNVEIAMQENGLPNTFVPGRNLLFMTVAATLAYRRGLNVLVGGMCETDFSGYPDCRDDTMKALQVALNLGMATRLKLETPLMWIDKRQTWELAQAGRRHGAGRPDPRADPHLLPGRARRAACLGLRLRHVPGMRVARARLRAVRGEPKRLHGLKRDAMTEATAALAGRWSDASTRRRVRALTGPWPVAGRASTGNATR